MLHSLRITHQNQLSNHVLKDLKRKENVSWIKHIMRIDDCMFYLMNILCGKWDIFLVFYK